MWTTSRGVHFVRLISGKLKLYLYSSPLHRFWSENDRVGKGLISMKYHPPNSYKFLAIPIHCDWPSVNNL